MIELKEIFKRPTFQIFCFLTAFGFLYLPFFRPTDPPFIVLLIGRFHPMVLHFPVVLILVAFVFEIANYFKTIKYDTKIRFLILAMAGVTTMVAVIAGTFLFASGNYSGDLIEQHFWGGAITGFLILIAIGFFLLSQTNPTYFRPYFFSLFLSNVSVAFTGHIGGVITHGSEYLTEYIPLVFGGADKSIQQKQENQMLVYDDMLAPIFETKCMSCHNAARTKGGLVMTSYSQIFKGGESGAISIDTINADNSELYKRVILPESNTDRMPPEGNSPLTNSEISLLKYWIESGAKAHLKVADVNDSLAQKSIKEITPDLTKYNRQILLSQIKEEELVDEMNSVQAKLNVSISKDSTADEDNLFILAMKFPPAPLTNDQFKELKPYARYFSKLSVVSSSISDDGLYHISKMTNLKALYLQKTGLKGDGIIQLQTLYKLEVLNLSFTEISDEYALDLLKIPSLKEVYLFQTNVTDQVVEAIRKNRQDLKVYLEEGPYL